MRIAKASSAEWSTAYGIYSLHRKRQIVHIFEECGELYKGPHEWRTFHVIFFGMQNDRGCGPGLSNLPPEANVPTLAVQETPLGSLLLPPKW